MDIDIYADVVCPWCYIGKRRLELALKDFDGEVNVRFRPFQLDPSTPRDGRPLMEWLAPKFGGAENAHRMTQNTRGVAAVDGIEMDFDHAIIANTFDAHRLVWFVGREQGAEVMEALHQAHFTDSARHRFARRARRRRRRGSVSTGSGSLASSPPRTASTR